MPSIKKVLNSSVVLVEENTKEYIVLSKGIGYGRKVGQEIELSESSQIFVPVYQQDRSHLLDLLKEIPATYLEISQNVVCYAEQMLHTSLNPHIYLALTDHLHFAVERVKKNMIVTNRVFWELKTFYPREYQIGLYANQLMKDKLGIDLPEEEAANVAFHIINARNDAQSQYDAMRAAKLIGKIVTVVTYSMKCKVNKENIHYARFISHLQYFCERFFTDKMLDSSNDFLYFDIQREYPQVISCAEKVRTLIIREYEKSIPNEEVAYLAIHIQRLCSRDD